MMDKQIDKYPYKKILYLQWYQAAIANLILFKHLKDRYMSHIYFLISDQGILLKATSNSYLKTTEEQINKFFTAKIQQLEISASSDFYERILLDIKQQTQKLKDTRDCPYINLVYSQKLKNSCLAMKKFGYTKPYQNWQISERERRGFCYLIVRPEHRWKQIANNVISLVKKREGAQKPEKQRTWQIELNYEQYIWLYLRKEYICLKKSLQVRQNKGQSIITVTFKNDITQFMELEKIINVLSFKFSQQKPNIPQKIQHHDKKQQLTYTIILSALQLQRITELIYHQYGLPNLVRQIRSKNLKYLIIGPEEEINQSSFNEQLNSLQNRSKLTLREDIGRLKDQENISIILKLGKSHQLINYKGSIYTMVRYELPLKNNIENMLKNRLPSLPRYFYCFERNREIFLLRKYETNKIKAALELNNLNNQIFLINSVIIVIKELHKRQIFIGNNLLEKIFVDGLRVVVEPSENGSKSQDIAKLKLLIRQWVKNMSQCPFKSDLQKLNDPNEMLPIFGDYLSENYL